MVKILAGILLISILFCVTVSADVIRFDGVDDMAVNKSTVPFPNVTVSIAFWQKILAPATAGYGYTMRYVLDGVASEGNANTVWIALDDNGLMRFDFQGDGATARLTSLTSWTYNVWYHFVVTHRFGDGSESLWYVNGVPNIGTWVGGLDSVVTNAGYKIHLNKNNTESYPMCLADFRMLDCILSRAEVNQIMNEGNPMNPEVSVITWTLSQDEGADIPDYSGNGYIGIYTPVTWVYDSPPRPYIYGD